MTSSRRKNNQRWVNSPWLHTASDIARRWNRPVPITSWTDCSDSMVPITTLCVIPIQRYRHLYLRRFQFHKGAIRTHFSCSHSANFRYFNSIKVRLEQTMLMPLNPTSKNFNSIKVRLEQSAAGSADNAAAFQFHKGAIRTTCRRFWTLRLCISIP